eukprot:2888377-Prorocentrum_lima.AAC.1
MDEDIGFRFLVGDQSEVALGVVRRGKAMSRSASGWTLAETSRRSRRVMQCALRGTALLPISGCVRDLRG